MIWHITTCLCTEIELSQSSFRSTIIAVCYKGEAVTSAAPAPVNYLRWVDKLLDGNARRIRWEIIIAFSH